MHPIFSFAVTASSSDNKHQTCAFLLPHTPLSRCGFLWVRSTTGCSASDSPGSRQHFPITQRKPSASLASSSRHKQGWTAHRRWDGGARAAGGNSRSSAPWEAAAPAQASVRALPSQADPAPPVPSRGTQHRAAGGCSLAYAEFG